MALMMEAVSAFESSINFNKPTERYIPVGCHIQTRLCQNLI
jgi:hypothetical protein